MELRWNLEWHRDPANAEFLSRLFGSLETGPVRRVQGIQDKEGKTRMIAILDYWSQAALIPLHKYLYTLLKKIPQDCTYNQASFIDKVSNWPVGVWYSVDLSKATDRFPIDVLVQVLEGRFSSEFVSAWKAVMVSLPFESDLGPVSYQCGNPMGAYSSWATFALAHHFVVFRCCWELGIDWSKAKYVLLGDDILIGDSALGERYRQMVSDLGVEVSPTKTFVSSEICEFAKRFL